MKRGKYRSREGFPVTAWVPREMLAAIDLAVLLEDSDRSKFLRKAIKDRAEKLGIKFDDLAIQG